MAIKRAHKIAGGVVVLAAVAMLARQFSSGGSFSFSSEGGPELSIAPSDEPFSLPERGSSLFDKIFSVRGADGVRTYQVPYPLQAIATRLTSVSGGVPPQQVIFPMGRSLQRVAAIAGLAEVPNTDPFFRYPRVVLGFDQESRNAADHLNLNLRGRFFLGFNEKAQILEVVSYNDEAGRFEYQVVRGYAPGVQPQVSYANRQLCLSCHQNQTPIFSQGPWQESNANPAMADGLERVLGSTSYFGAPTRVDQSVPQSLDRVIRVANLYPAFHKMWQRLCPDLACRKELLKQVLLYKLTGSQQLLLNKDLQNLNALLASRWKEQFPNGMAIPDSSIPNRDPLVDVNERGTQNLSVISGKAASVKSALHDVIANSNIPGEFEPANPRAALPGPWLSAFLDREGIARLIDGYAEFFTADDARLVDGVLSARGTGDVETLPADCTLAKNTGYTLHCVFSAAGRVSLTAFVQADGAEWTGTAGLVRVQTSGCDPNMLATAANLSGGMACPQAENVRVRLHMDGSNATLSFRSQGDLSVRFLDGRRLLPVAFTWPLQASVHLEFKIIRDLAPLSQALEQAFASPDRTDDKTGGFSRYVKGPALNRGAVMAMVMRYLGQPHDELLDLTADMASLKRVSEAPVDETKQFGDLTPVQKALTLAMHNCGTCHYNVDNVPPAYLGAPGVSASEHDRCQRLATCAPRMLYRLKMWECAPADYAAKKSPMPPLGRLKSLGLDGEAWKSGDRVQLFQALQAVFPKAELPGILQSSGMTAEEAGKVTAELQTLGCEPRRSDVFEKFPACDVKIPIHAAECGR